MLGEGGSLGEIFPQLVSAGEKNFRRYKFIGAVLYEGGRRGWIELDFSDRTPGLEKELA